MMALQRERGEGEVVKDHCDPFSPSPTPHSGPHVVTWCAGIQECCGHSWKKMPTGVYMLLLLAVSVAG